MIADIDITNPPDSGIAAYFDKDNNVWINEDGFPIIDLKCFGFTALQRQTILDYIHNNPEANYMCVPNNANELIEIFWKETDWAY